MPPTVFTCDKHQQPVRVDACNYTTQSTCDADKECNWCVCNDDPVHCSWCNNIPPILQSSSTFPIKSWKHTNDVVKCDKGVQNPLIPGKIERMTG